MQNEAAEADKWQAESYIERTISRAFLAAHLLTASRQQAESAVMEALDSWDPAKDNEEALLPRVLRAAVRAQFGALSSSFNEPVSARVHLPAELRSVLALPPQLRRCFVLRILIGLSQQVCARLLYLRSYEVNQYTSAALKCLPAITKRSLAGTQYLAPISRN
jgi:DNA-directed RNA polymerase specialized sigma24 family protein